jgi:hypothetical protein
MEISFVKSRGVSEQIKCRKSELSEIGNIFKNVGIGNRKSERKKRRKSEIGIPKHLWSRGARTAVFIFKFAKKTKK